MSTGLDQEVLKGYFRALKRADEKLRADPTACLPLWQRNIPPELQGDYDYARFSLGELLVFEPYDQAFFQQTQSWLDLWGLRSEMKQTDYEQLVTRVAI